jgi:Mrp family chromosome partitioning ATPase
MEPGASLPTEGAGFVRADSEQAPILSPTLAPSPPVPQPFKSGWQVDQFTWPKLCRRLITRAAAELDRLADALIAANMQGQKVLAIAGCRRGEGATTLLLCAARRLAERGIKPVLVDADLVQPRLAKRLGVQPQFGWDETEEEEGRSLGQAIVEATGNNVALLPAREPSAESNRPAGDAAQLPACLGVLREHYDMVLVDLGPLEETDPAQGGLCRAARLVDAVVLVHNHRITSAEHLAACQEQLTAAGIVVTGIVENFVPAD